MTPVVSLADAKKREPTDAGGLHVPLVRDDGEPTPFPVDALGPLRNVVEGVADVTQAPRPLCAQSALAVASLATQGLADVEAPGGGRAPLSLFLLTIAASGERKSGADRRAMEGVERFEKSLAMGDPEELASYNNRKQLHDARQKELLKLAAKGDEDAAGELEAMREPRPPLQPTITSSAPTLEGVTRNLGVLRPSLGISRTKAARSSAGTACGPSNGWRRRPSCRADGMAKPCPGGGPAMAWPSTAAGGSRVTSWCSR